MKILICPDKFKGSLSAEMVCAAIKRGLLSVDGNLKITNHPMADGGDGSIEILKSILKLSLVKIQTLDPLFRKMEAEYYCNNDAAFIELASASGLVLLSEDERNPMMTSTIGTGLLIKDALDKGFKKIYLFIGGSATNDGGIGIAQALGYKFKNEAGTHLEPIGCSLTKIDRVDYEGIYDFKEIEIDVLCDVTNPMFGNHGAAYVYAAQKGASSDDIRTLDLGLQHYAKILEIQYQKDVNNLPGVGAAGAVGASLVGLLNANLQNGFNMLSKATNLESAIKNSDLVITGEGKIDHTSFKGKVVGNVMDICNKYKVPCGVVGGIIDIDEDIPSNFFFHHSIMPLAKNLNEAMRESEYFLKEIGNDIGHQLQMINKKNLTEQ